MWNVKLSFDCHIVELGIVFSSQTFFSSGRSDSLYRTVPDMVRSWVRTEHAIEFSHQTERHFSNRSIICIGLYTTVSFAFPH